MLLKPNQKDTNIILNINGCGIQIIAMGAQFMQVRRRSQKFLFIQETNILVCNTLMSVFKNNEDCNSDHIIQIHIKQPFPFDPRFFFGLNKDSLSRPLCQSVSFFYIITLHNTVCYEHYYTVKTFHRLSLSSLKIANFVLP